MMRVVSWIFGVVVMGLIGWAVASIIPRYTVNQMTYISSEESGGLDIRISTGHLIAQYTVMTGDMDTATAEAVTVLKGYILGDNSKTTNSPFTKSADQKASEDIAMVEPIISQSNFDGSTTVTFIMPDDYTTLSSLPTPNNKDIVTKILNSEKYAVLTFNGKVTPDIFHNLAQSFVDKLKVNKIHIVSSPELLRYDPEWSIPYLQRNEIRVMIK